MMKTCNKCGENYETTICKPCKNAYAAKRYAENKEKVKAINMKWRANNMDQHIAYNKKWAAINKDKFRAYTAKYRSINPGKDAIYRSENKEECKARISEWKTKNKQLLRIYDRNRRARERNADGKLSKGLAEKLFKLQHGKCPCCGEPLGDDYHLDHKMPLALGGSNTDDNIQLLRSACNLQKSAKHPIDFMRGKGFLL